jgi:hypothetical protein
MTKMRDHLVYTINLKRDTKHRIEDNLGELVGYSDSYEMSETLTVVAPSEAVAIAWALQHRVLYNPAVESVTWVPLDGFVQEHIW